MVKGRKGIAAGVVQGDLGKGNMTLSEFGLIDQGCVTRDIALFFEAPHTDLAGGF